MGTDLLALSAVGDRTISAAAEDGFLWKEELHRLYPNSELNAANMQDWKHAFMCEMNQTVAGLRCFYTKATFDDEGVVLGIPIYFTVNPKTKRTDYIRSTMELLSHDAFKVDKVRHTVWREEFTHWLPMYITEEHWQKALPLLIKHIPGLLPNWQTTRFHPDMCLEVFSKAINTLVVLLCDKGERYSESAAKGYCMWHRWILRCVQEWPQLLTTVDSRIKDFCRGEDYRSKAKEPNVGEFIPLLLISERYQWSNVVAHILSEWLDRQVLWLCTEHPELAEIGEKDRLTDSQRVELSWSGKPVGRRLYAFHAVFLSIFKRQDMKTTSMQYDRFYGHPGPSSLRRTAQGFSAVMTMENWPHYFKILHIACPSKANLAAMMKKSVNNSVRRGYHQQGMDFNRVHRSGVSTILKKGESYLAAADLKTVELHDSWAWDGETKFLDATCFVYDKTNNKLGHLDFLHLSSPFLGKASSGVLVHSGDQMDEYKQSGKHTITMQLDRLPQDVSSLYLALSAWDGKRLSEIKQPHVRLVDQSTGQELCRYDVDGAKDAHKHTAILMCVLHRRGDRSTRGCTRWALEAIGDIGGGSAADYKPIEKMVEDFRKKRGL